MKVIEDPVYGQIEFDSEFEMILLSPPILRLKEISQGGYVFLSYPKITTNRFEHSLGVCHLIKKLGGTKLEQIAGILHDISHTAFSHVIDYILRNDYEDYHEKIRIHFLKDQSLINALSQLGFKTLDFEEENKFNLLEQPLPKLCADRIDYTLRDLLAWGFIDRESINFFLSCLENLNGEIIVNNKEAALWFREKYNILNIKIYGDPRNVYARNSLTDILKQGLDKKIIELKDFEKSDFNILKKIESSELKDLFDQIKENLKTNNYLIQNEVVIKKRQVDPLVRVGNKIVPLSKL